MCSEELDSTLLELSTVSLHAEYQEHPSGDDPPTGGEWVVTDIAAGSQLGTEQRVREKEAIVTSAGTYHLH